MKFFIDTADLDEIKEAASWGILSGVTTNPSLYARTGGKLADFEGMVLISLVMASMSTVLMARKSQRFNPVLLCGWQFMIGGLGLVAVALALGGRVDFVGHPTGLLQLGWLVMVSAVAYGVWSLLLRDNDVSRVAVFEFEIPVFGVLISLLLLGTEGATVGWGTVAALVLVTIGILMVESSPKAGAVATDAEPAYSRNSA